MSQTALLGTCPLPKTDYDRVLLGHGSGGQLTADLIENIFLPAFDNQVLASLEDQAKFEIPGVGAATHQLAFTTDSFVVQPIFFPGGDIGRLAVHGTVNDLAVGGAQPICLSAAFILEEGFLLDDLQRVARSMREACDESGITLVTGDTKVVDKGKGDGIYITTSGIGVVSGSLNLSIANAQPGDAVIVSGTIGDHGIAIMSVREGLEFDTVLESDSASLYDLTRVMLQTCPGIRCMRDATRGGLSSVLNEIATASGAGIELDETTIPCKREVHAACELLGLDPLYVANEGKLVVVVPADHADHVMEAMRRHPLGRDAAIIGHIVEDHPRMVVLKSLVGGERVVTMIAGEQLPRIC